MATRAAQKAETYESELVALAHRALDSTFAAYRVGRAGFGQLYQAEVALLELERGAIRARVEAAVAATRLVTLTGRWLSEDRR
jgi:outer membrane protein TolC